MSQPKGARLPARDTEMQALEKRIDQLLQRFLGDAAPSIEHVAEREAALLEIFSQCGLQASGPKRFKRAEASFEVDGEFEASIDGVDMRIAIEIKTRARPESIRAALKHASRIRHEGRYDRALVVIAGDVPELIRREAETDNIGYIDLLGIRELRSWLWKHAPALQPLEEPSGPTCAMIIREAMKAIAERLARAPHEIMQIGWRDMERVLREVFEGMGFETELTRSGKDGGFDLSLRIAALGNLEIYLVEVKHWTAQKPGRPHLRKLVRVTARQQATKGILLSSSGFAPTIYEGITEAERRTVAIGTGDKIIALCRTYYRLGQQIWTPDTSISGQLMDGLI